MSHGGLETHLATGRLQVRQFVLSYLMSTDTNLFVYAYSNFNKAVPSGLVAEEALNSS